ncbi:MAG: pantetheine-phosphate adenylyltransferase [Peptostreptococcales bacterium]|jgi:pantetheine-phosphate adenylyltransferase
MTINLYPGTFDPITNGHLDIIKRALRFSDELIVAVLNNPTKKPFFTVEERMEIIKEVTKDLPNVRVDSFSGFVVDYVKKNNINSVIRGLRGVADFEYELQMSQMNSEIYPDMERVFLMTRGKYSYISSSLVKEVFSFGGDIGKVVPKEVVKHMEMKSNK